MSVHQGNVGDREDCRRVVGEVIAQHGRLDILVNNAGVTADRPILGISSISGEIGNIGQANCAASKFGPARRRGRGPDRAGQGDPARGRIGKLVADVCREPFGRRH